jgi:uncharacterized membrane protein
MSTLQEYAPILTNIKTRIEEMAGHPGTVRKLIAREISHESFEEHVAASTPGESQEVNAQESMAAEEDDVGAIFRRLAEAKTEEA